MTGTVPTLDAVLESYMLDSGTEGALSSYLQRYPQFSVELIDLAHQAQRLSTDEQPPLDAAALVSIDAIRRIALAAWPQEAAQRNLFAELRPADYGRVSRVLGVPRQVIGAVKDGLAITSSIPTGWLQRFAEELGGTVSELLASIGVGQRAASYKSEERPETKEAVAFEQILIEAKVDERRRAEIMSGDA